MEHLNMELYKCGLTIEELERKCKLVFKYCEQKFERERKKRRSPPANKLEAGIQFDKPVVKKRKVIKPRLPSSEDNYVELLRKVLSVVFELNKMDHSKQFSDVSNWKWNSGNLHIERGILHLLFAYGFHRQLLAEMEAIDFSQWPKQWHSDVKNLWRDSTYRVSSGKPYEKQTPVDTFRIRSKHPDPIDKLYGPSRYNIDRESLDLLNKTFKHQRRPSRQVKDLLAIETGLSPETIANWFKNKRQRESKSSQGSISEQSTSGSSVEDFGHNPDPCKLDPRYEILPDNELLFSCDHSVFLINEADCMWYGECFENYTY